METVSETERRESRRNSVRKSERLRSFSMTIFVPAGDPEGIRVIDKPNWIGKGIVFPRSLFDEEVRSREELKLPGVYVLWDAGGSGQLPSTYVGEGTVLRERLDDHMKNKDFWTHGVTFTSKDKSLNKAHFKYLEARLVKLADEAMRCKLHNSTRPKTPELSDVDMAVAEPYLADMLLCLPIVGVSFFKKPRGTAGKKPEAVPEFQRDTGMRL